jgi:hypothetical protein
LLGVHHEQEDTAFPNSVFHCIFYVRYQLRLASASNPAGIPNGKWLRASRAKAGNAIACHSWLIVHDRHLSPDQAIKKS